MRWGLWLTEIGWNGSLIQWCEWGWSFSKLSKLLLLSNLSKINFDSFNTVSSLCDSFDSFTTDASCCVTQPDIPLGVNRAVWKVLNCQLSCDSVVIGSHQLNVLKASALELICQFWWREVHAWKCSQLPKMCHIFYPNLCVKKTRGGYHNWKTFWGQIWTHPSYPLPSIWRNTVVDPGGARGLRPPGL